MAFINFVFYGYDLGTHLMDNPPAWSLDEDDRIQTGLWTLEWANRTGNEDTVSIPVALDWYGPKADVDLGVGHYLYVKESLQQDEAPKLTSISHNIQTVRDLGPWDVELTKWMQTMEIDTGRGPMWWFGSKVG